MARTKKVVETETEVSEVVKTKEVNAVVYDTVAKQIVCIPVSQVTANHKYI